METLRAELKAYGGGVFCFDDTNTYLHLVAYSQTKVIDSAVKYIGGDLSRFKFPISNHKLLLTKCAKEKKIVEATLLSDFFSPVVPKLSQDIIQKITKLKYCIGVPIIVRGNTIGVLFANFQKSNISPNELSLLKFYANLSGLAIENSRKRDELEKKYQLEKETTALLSHELKTPIAIAYNSAQMYKLLLDKNSEKLGPMFKDFEEIHEDVKSSVSRLNQICNSIFSLMEVEKTKDVTLHKLDLEHRLEQVIANFERKAKEKGLKFNSDLKCKSGIYYGGGVQLEQIITILADNAIKYTNSGLVDLSITQKNNKIVCIITDTGCGIPPNKRHAVFERFYRHKSLKNKYLYDTKGLGLGLYVAQQIVKKLDGKITVDNNPKGRGTRFTVEIPVYKKLREKTADNTASYY